MSMLILVNELLPMQF